MKISEIKSKLKASPSDAFVNSLKDDPRKGVQQALKSYYHQVEYEKSKKLAFEKRLQFEHSFWDKGLDLVAGIDEVGRGPLAGPVVSAAVILPHDFHIIEVNDSKQLSAQLREDLYQKILKQSIAVGIGIADAQVIDQLNIYQATRQAMLQAVNNLQLQPDQLIIDAMEIDAPFPQLKLIKGDSKSASVAAASIIAKVYRDRLMQFYDRIYSGYDFSHNVGYGTQKHLAGLKKYGVTPIHRRSFGPVKIYK